MRMLASLALLTSLHADTITDKSDIRITEDYLLHVLTDRDFGIFNFLKDGQELVIETSANITVTRTFELKLPANPICKVKLVNGKPKLVSIKVK